jgi:RNA polymerase sigma-70 factor (ECF subfamily)
MAPSEVEAAIRELFDAGDLRAAATVAIHGYGGEVCGYLAAILRDDEQARDVFAETLAEMWRALPRFRWDASFRTWIYTLARHRLSAHLSRNERRRAVALAQAPEIAELEATARTATAPWRRTEVKNAVSQLREGLSVEDQTLLILRIDRQMSWRKIAQILGDAGEPALRKRFARIKDRLRALALSGDSTCDQGEPACAPRSRQAM